MNLIDAAVKPTPGHLAIAELYRTDKLDCVITKHLPVLYQCFKERN